jgi:hypothetical protein
MPQKNLAGATAVSKPTLEAANGAIILVVRDSDQKKEINNDKESSPRDSTSREPRKRAIRAIGYKA